jgi:hypothetical protein
VTLTAGIDLHLEVGADLRGLPTSDPITVALADAFAAGGITCYPGFLPPGTADDPFERYPCVTYRQISGGRGYAHDGFTGRRNPLWEVNAWARSYDAARLLAEDAMDALEAALDAELTATKDDREPQTGATRVILTVNVWM